MKKIALLALYSIFLVALYQLAVIPLLLDFSFIGLLVLGAGALLGFFAIPRPWRRWFALLSLLILLVSYGVMNIYSDSLAWRFLEFPLLFAILGWIASSYGRIRWRYTLTVVTALAVFLAIVPFWDMPFYAKFRLPFKSEVLDRRPLFSVYPVVGQGRNIYTLGDYRKLTDADIKAADPTGKKNPLDAAEKLKSQLEHTDVLRFSADDGYKKHTASKEEVAALPFTSFGLAGFPYYASSWTVENGAVKQHFTPVDDPKTVLTSFFDPLSVTVAMQDRAARSVQESRQNWSAAFGKEASPQYPGAALVGKGKFLPGSGSQLLLMGNNELRLVDESSPNGPPIAVYKGTFDRAMAKNFAIGDIDGDGIDELMVNTVPAMILKLNANRTWDKIWESGKESFRFEFVLPQPGGKPLIVAQDPSLIRDVPTRYLTGYTWDNGRLERQWRVYKTNLLFPFPLSSDTWVAGYYSEPHLFVFKPIPVPVVPTLAGIYAAMVLGGYGYQLVQRRKRRYA
ncbi:hypothetical protein [Effusibacillus pohliae]|uniref:hypothetical protein n=1 Tax=Effusibacillus pohliae TaxID=232270 RepID=UPI000361D6C0|nr:hypothetical protein [Effusibacillus pohliae]